MTVFFVALLLLILGYIFYGRVVEKVFNPDSNRKTPAYTMSDGVDYVPMSNLKNTLIQFLNIAGTGPIFGAIMGAAFGPIVFLWIVLGSIFGGAVHDYMVGMVSVRNEGKTIVGLSEKYLGKVFQHIFRVFSLILLILVGTVFITSPAALLAQLTPTSFYNGIINILEKICPVEFITSINPSNFILGFWITIIFIYYILATFLPIDKIIGKIYPIFGAVLVIMSVAVIVALFGKGYTLPTFTLENLHPTGRFAWPFLFLTVTCGAISGFHSTQSPIIARCLKNEKDGRKIFYGAMIIEAVVALIWASAGMGFYDNLSTLYNLVDSAQGGSPSAAIYDIANGLLGKVGGALAIVAVVICPITSGDTVFRSARMVLVEWLKLPQDKVRNRILIIIPLFIISAILTRIDFQVLWRYFSFANQILAVIALWCVTAYLIKNTSILKQLITALPASVLTSMCFTYILMADEGLRLTQGISTIVGVSLGVISFIVYLVIAIRKKGIYEE